MPLAGGVRLRGIAEDGAHAARAILSGNSEEVPRSYLHLSHEECPGIPVFGDIH